MNTNFRKLTIAITITAAVLGTLIAFHPNPTEQQRKLGEAVIFIMVKGATTLMGIPNILPESE